ncbi:MAG: alpha/beta fold hydrolase [Vulcanimicrobiaceae bacterium]
MNVVRRGAGKPLLLVHGLGGFHGSWDTIGPALAARRETIAVDLPGHGATPPLPAPSFAALADALVDFLRERDLIGVDAVGSSMGARLVLELARRGVVGNVVSLDPGGFWKGWERPFFGTTVGASVKLVRALRPVLPLLTGNAVTRTLLFAQFSARPWELPADIALAELRSFAASPSFDELLEDLAEGAPQLGAAVTPGRVTIGWGRRDLVCLPVQAARARKQFPTADFHWFERSGHFPHWDEPAETVRLIFAKTA